MKITMKMFTFLAGIFTLTLIVYFLTRKSARKHEEKIKKGKMVRFDINPLPQANQTPDVNVLQTIPSMPLASAMHTENNVIANFPDLDRAPLDDEPLTLLPANEIIATNYKDWYAGAGAAGIASATGAGADSVDKELYAQVNPLFRQGGKAELVPLDVNGTQRRVNFY